MNTKTSPAHNPVETISRDELGALQSKKLPEVVRYVFDNNPVQQERFMKAGVNPEDIRGIDDLQRLPTMNKNDFRANYPLGLSCVEKKSIVEMHMSSGSTGAPVVMPYTEADLGLWAECMARCLRMAGAEPADVIQITPSFGLFNAGFGFYHGAEALGLFVLPTGSGNTQQQLRIAKDFNTRIMTGIVSYGIRLMEMLQESGEDLPDLEVGIFGAETFSESMKKKLAVGLGIEVFDIYGVTELGGVGTAMDCPAHAGLHFWEDQCIVEIIDSVSEKPVPDGEMGELVITSLTREALPAIRFRTGDLTRVVSRDRCACGRTHIRVAPITGRTDDMLIVKGVSFFPSQVEEVLMKVPHVSSNYQIIVEEVEGIYTLYINAEAKPGPTGKMPVTAKTIEKRVREAMGFMPKVTLFPVGQLPRYEGSKAKRVFYKDAHGGLH